MSSTAKEISYGEEVKELAVLYLSDSPTFNQLGVPEQEAAISRVSQDVQKALEESLEEHGFGDA